MDDESINPIDQGESEAVDMTEPVEAAETAASGEERPAGEFDFGTAYGDLQAAETPPETTTPGDTPDEPTDDFAAAFARDPEGTIRHLTEAAARAAVEPLRQADARRAYAANLQSLAGEYPAVATAEGHTQLAAALQTIVREWGAGHLLANPPAELLEAAARRAFGGAGRASLSAREAGTMEQIRAKQGLAATTTKPKTTARTPEDEAADMIVSAGHRKGIFG